MAVASGDFRWLPGPTPNPAPLQRLRALSLTVVALALAVISAAVGGLAVLMVVSPHLSPLHPVAQARGAMHLGESVQRVAVRVLPSVVKLEMTLGPMFSEGSGIVLSTDGVILTNDHVVSNPFPVLAGSGKETNLVTFSDGRTVPFTVVGADPFSDIAVIRAQDVSGLTPIELGSSTDLVVGQNVVAVGAPLGLAGTVTTGIVSALHRPVSSPGNTAGDRTVIDAIQTDAAINPGNSGGALVDSGGALIGVNSASATTGGDYVNGPGGSIGLGFAIPVEQALRVANQLLATGTATHATLGFDVASDTPPQGARIIGVDPTGPAAGARLPVGALITKVDDRIIASADDLLAALQSKSPGDTLVLTYTDPHGPVETTKVTLGSA